MNYCAKTYCAKCLITYFYLCYTGTSKCWCPESLERHWVTFSSGPQLRDHNTERESHLPPWRRVAETGCLETSFH